MVMKEICANCKHNKRTYDGHCNAEFCCEDDFMNECFVIKFNDGNYWCGNNTLSKQIHNAKFFVSELNAEKCVERLSKKIERIEHYLLIPLKNAILSGYRILTVTINVKEE